MTFLFFALKFDLPEIYTTEKKKSEEQKNKGYQNILIFFCSSLVHQVLDTDVC